MIILKSNKKCDAMEIIKENGFIDATPSIGLCSSKIFKKDGNYYKFNGWHHHTQNGHLEDIAMGILSKDKTMTIDELKARLNGKIQDFKMYEYICALSLYIDELTPEEIHKANEQFKVYLTIAPSKETGERVLYMKIFNNQKPLEKQADFYKLVKEENDFKKEHNQQIITYNHKKIVF